MTAAAMLPRWHSLPASASLEYVRGWRRLAARFRSRGQRVVSASPQRSRSPLDARARMTAPQADGISILLVDDHPIVRQGYRRVLENQSDFRVVAEADNAASAYGAFKVHAPDVVVMDISMPGP